MQLSCTPTLHVPIFANNVLELTKQILSLFCFHIPAISICFTSYSSTLSAQLPQLTIAEVAKLTHLLRYA